MLSEDAIYQIKEVPSYFSVLLFCFVCVLLFCFVFFFDEYMLNFI